MSVTYLPAAMWVTPRTGPAGDTEIGKAKNRLHRVFKMRVSRTFWFGPLKP